MSVIHGRPGRYPAGLRARRRGCTGPVRSSPSRAEPVQLTPTTPAEADPHAAARAVRRCARADTFSSPIARAGCRREPRGRGRRRHAGRRQLHVPQRVRADPARADRRALRGASAPLRRDRRRGVAADGLDLREGRRRDRRVCRRPCGHDPDSRGSRQRARDARPARPRLPAPCTPWRRAPPRRTDGGCCRPRAPRRKAPGRRDHARPRRARRGRHGRHARRVRRATRRAAGHSPT